MAQGINIQAADGKYANLNFEVGASGDVSATIPKEGGELATKEYADLKVALTDFTGANQNLSANGYQKLPGGLIIQWGATAVVGTEGTTATYPITFPNTVFNTVISRNGTEASDVNCIAINKSTSSFQIFAYNPTGTSIGGVITNWIAIGC